MVKKYSQIRGVCHNPKWGQSQEALEKELGYAKRLHLNSIRFWLDQKEWEKNGQAYENLILNFVKSCWRYNISVMPILWNGNGIEEYSGMNTEEWEKARLYAEAMIRLLGNEPGLLMWDVYNEPFCNDFLRSAKTKEEYEKRKAPLSQDLRKLCEMMKAMHPGKLITVGHERYTDLEDTADLVDVISFHDYSPTRKEIRKVYDRTFAIAEKYGKKPVLNTETGCIGRANPYETELMMCEEYGCGFYLFNLIIERFWGGIHGLVYEDGTIRDPGVIAALFGFYRNMTDQRVLQDGNRERHAYMAVERVRQVLEIERAAMFRNKEKTTDEILEAAEYCINILECCELVPMAQPLSAELQKYRNQSEDERSMDQIRRFAFETALKVKEAFEIL